MDGHPPLTFAAIGLDHRHIYHQVGRLLELGARCAGYHARDDAVPLEGFVKRFPDLERVADSRARRVSSPIAAMVPSPSSGIGSSQAAIARSAPGCWTAVSSIDRR